MTDQTPRCPWCSAQLPAGSPEACPSCGATLTSPTGAEPEIAGVTSLDPIAIMAGKAEAPRSRNRLMSFITGEAPGEGDAAANLGSLAPPDEAVRREMLRLEIEAERADLEAESVALKTDIIVEQNISLAALASVDTLEEAEEVRDAKAAAGQVPSAPAAAPAPVAPAPVAPAPVTPPVQAPPAVPAAPPAPADAGDQTGV